LRVPASELPAAISALKNLGHLESESQSGEEVTQQHADLVARLKNASETETRLQAILQQRTGKVADVLAVEQEIARVRGEIEQMQAEQKALEHRVDFSTIELNLTEEYKAQLDGSSPSVSTRMHNALVNGFDHAAESLLGLLLFFMEAGPILLLWSAVLFLPAFFLIRRYRRAATAS
jgi:chromosome segregation ATPase